MKKIIAGIIAACLCVTMMFGCLISAETRSTTVNKMVAFGDSVIAGYCGKGPDKAADAYGDQKAVDLLGKEFGLTRYTSASKIKSDNAEKWFYNGAISGYRTDQILNNEIKGFDSELLAQADLVVMNGGTNDACFTVTGALSECGWGSLCADWTFDETKAFVDKYSAQFKKIADQIVKPNFISIIKYFAGLDGFDGKIIIENYPNQYAGSDNTNAEYFWDQFYEMCITSAQKAAVEETKDIYSNIELLDVTAKVRDGEKYTNVIYGDAQHMTFAGNRAVYFELSKMLNSDGANMLTFEDNTIPEGAKWRTIYDFENYNVGDTNIENAPIGYETNKLEVVNMSDTYDSDGNPKQGTNTNSKKILKVYGTKPVNDSFSVRNKLQLTNLSKYTSNAYGIKISFTYDYGNNVGMRYLDLKMTDGSMCTKVLPINDTEWGTTELVAGSSVNSNTYATILNASEIKKITQLTIYGDRDFGLYVDDIEVLTTDTDLPESTSAATATTSPTSKATTTTTTTTTTKPAATQPTTSSGGETVTSDWKNLWDSNTVSLPTVAPKVTNEWVTSVDGVTFPDGVTRVLSTNRKNQPYDCGNVRVDISRENGLQDVTKMRVWVAGNETTISKNLKFGLGIVVKDGDAETYYMIDTAWGSTPYKMTAEGGWYEIDLSKANFYQYSATYVGRLTGSTGTATDKSTIPFDKVVGLEFVYGNIAGGHDTAEEYYTGSVQYQEEVKVTSHTITFTDCSVKCDPITGTEVTLPNYAPQSGYLLGWYVDNKTILRPGSTITLTENMTVSALETDFSVETGAGVRWAKNPTDRGLRFRINVKKSVMDKFLGGQDNALLSGTIFAPADKLSGNMVGGFTGENIGEFTLENLENIDGIQVENMDNYVYNYTYSANGSNNDYYYGGISGMNMKDSESIVTKSFAARGYLIIKYSDGTQKTLYTAFDSTNVRSAQQVAAMALNDTAANYSADQIGILKGQYGADKYTGDLVADIKESYDQLGK